jgi:hypothetical protein
MFFIFHDSLSDRDASIRQEKFADAAAQSPSAAALKPIATANLRSK